MMERPSAIVGVGAFAYLIYFHATSSSGEAWKAGNIDITGLLMVLTLKVTACALNYQDAAAPLDRLSGAFSLHWFPYDRVGVVNADP